LKRAETLSGEEDELRDELERRIDEEEGYSDQSVDDGASGEEEEDDLGADEAVEESATTPTATAATATAQAAASAAPSAGGASSASGAASGVSPDVQVLETTANGYGLFVRTRVCIAVDAEPQTLRVAFVHRLVPAPATATSTAGALDIIPEEAAKFKEVVRTMEHKYRALPGLDLPDDVKSGAGTSASTSASAQSSASSSLSSSSASATAAPAVHRPTVRRSALATAMAAVAAVEDEAILAASSSSSSSSSDASGMSEFERITREIEQQKKFHTKAGYGWTEIFDKMKERARKWEAEQAAAAAAAAAAATAAPSAATDASAVNGGRESAKKKLKVENPYANY
jgi:hypothetical protein